MEIQERRYPTCINTQIPVDSCKCYLVDLVKLRIYLYWLCIMPLADFILRVISLFEVGSYIFPIQIETVYKIPSYLSLFHCITYSLDIPTFMYVSG